MSDCSVRPRVNSHPQNAVNRRDDAEEGALLATQQRSREDKQTRYKSTTSQKCCRVH